MEIEGGGRGKGCRGREGGKQREPERQTKLIGCQYMHL